MHGLQLDMHLFTRVVGDFASHSGEPRGTARHRRIERAAMRERSAA